MYEMSESEENQLDISVVEVRGKKRVSFNGLEHLKIDDDKKTQLLDRYEKIILDIDRIREEYSDENDFAWHIGRYLDKKNISGESDITYEDIAKFNTVDLNSRRLHKCRDIYRFYDEGEYLDKHNVTALSDLASRAQTQDRVEEAKEGYNRLRDRELDMPRHTVFAWFNLYKKYGEPGYSLDRVVEEVSVHYDKPKSVVENVRRVLVLLDQSDYDRNELKKAVERNIDRERLKNE